MAARRTLPNGEAAPAPWLKGSPPPPRQPRRLDVRQALDADLKQDAAIFAAYTHLVRHYAELAAQPQPAPGQPSPEQVISALRAVSLSASRLAGTLRTLRLMGAHEAGARQLLLDLYTELRRLKEAEP